MERSYKQRVIAAAVLVFFVIGTSVAAAGCGGTAKADGGAIKITDADNGKTVAVKTGDTVQVILEGNPTTGYQWTATLTDKDKAIAQQQGDAAYVQQSTDSSVVGAGGTYTFTFKAVAAGQATLTFAYARSFDKGVAPAKTFTVTLTVK